MSEQQESRPSFSNRLGKAIRWLLGFLLRIVAVLVIGAALGGALYFGFLFLYQEYVQPVAVNSLRLDIMDDQQGQSREQLHERLADLQERVDSLEVQGDRDKETISGLTAQLAAAEQAQTEQAAGLLMLSGVQDDLEQAQAQLASIQAALEAAQVAQSALEALEVAQEALVADLGEMESAQDATDGDLDDLRGAQRSAQSALNEVQSAQGALQEALTEVQAQVAALDLSLGARGNEISRLSTALEGENSPQVLLRELQIVKVMALLSRSRLLLVQNNLGLARSDAETARGLLAELQADGPEYQADALGAIMSLLDQALESLLDAPVAAADQLDGAWELLVAGLPDAPPEIEETPVVEETPAAEETPAVEETSVAEETPAAEETPVVEETPVAEATPAAEETPTVEATPAEEATPTATPSS